MSTEWRCVQAALTGLIKISAPVCPAQVNGKPGKGKLMLELRMLKLADAQARLRTAVEKEQEEVQNLSDRNYRKFVRNCLRQRIESIKQVKPEASHAASVSSCTATGLLKFSWC